MYEPKTYEEAVKILEFFHTKPDTEKTLDKESTIFALSFLTSCEKKLLPVPIIDAWDYHGLLSLIWRLNDDLFLKIQGVPALTIIHIEYKSQLKFSMLVIDASDLVSMVAMFLKNKEDLIEGFSNGNNCT